MRIVHAHYAIIRKLVCRVSLRINPEDWNVLAQELNKFIPGIGLLPMVDVISTFILQVTTIHSLDHHTIMRHRR